MPGEYRSDPGARTTRAAVFPDRNAVDALSEILKSIRMEGAVYLDAEFAAPWCVQARHGLSSVKRRLAGAEHVVFFHFFVQGGCKVALEDGKELAIQEGDLVIFPRDDHQRMGSDLRLVPREAVTFRREESESSGCLIRIPHGGG